MNAALIYKILSLVSPGKENGQIVALSSPVQQCELWQICLNISSISVDFKADRLQLPFFS